MYYYLSILLFLRKIIPVLLIHSSVLFFICQYIILNSPIQKKNYIIYNILSISLIELFIYIFGFSYLLTISITTILFVFISITSYYVHEFRGTNINFSDILSIPTAKEVAGGYKYSIKPNIVIGVIASIFTIFIIDYVIKNYFTILLKYYTLMSVLDTIDFSYLSHFYLIPPSICIIIFLIIILLIVFLLLRKKINNSYYDYSLNAGEKEGYIYNLFSSIPIFHKSEKAKIMNNKNNDNIINLLSFDKEKLINFDINNKQNPHIIVIMNESFGTVHERINTNTLVTPYFDMLNGVTKGKLFVNTFGGGTANTEFEFLTSITIGNLPYPMYPYNNFVKHDKYSLVRYMKQLGYDTVAMHPYTATNYNRNVVYKNFGFDKLIFHDEFVHKEKQDLVRNFVSDKSMYLEVIDKYNEYKNLNKKLFLFGITMQNHSGYDSFEGEQVFVTDKIEYDSRQLNSYLSLMKISDDAIKTLIDYFDKEEERVIICFFGDHNASFESSINKLYYNITNEYEGSPAYLTPFFIYDNKNKKDEIIEKSSANFLAIDLLKKSNIPLNDYYKYIDEIYSNNQFMNYHKTYDKNLQKLHNINDNLTDYMKLVNYYLYS